MRRQFIAGNIQRHAQHHLTETSNLPSISYNASLLVVLVFFFPQNYARMHTGISALHLQIALVLTGHVTVP